MFVLYSLGSVFSKKTCLASSVCTQKNTLNRDIMKSFERLLLIENLSKKYIMYNVHCTLKVELSYFDRYLDVLVPEVGDVHRAADLSVPHTQSTQIAREGGER
jgi:hypothetical protein